MPVAPGSLHAIGALSLPPVPFGVEVCRQIAERGELAERRLDVAVEDVVRSVRRAGTRRNGAEELHVADAGILRSTTVPLCPAEREAEEVGLADNHLHDCGIRARVVASAPWESGTELLSVHAEPAAAEPGRHLGPTTEPELIHSVRLRGIGALPKDVTGVARGPAVAIGTDIRATEVVHGVAPLGPPGLGRVHVDLVVVGDRVDPEVHGRVDDLLGCAWAGPGELGGGGAAALEILHPNVVGLPPSHRVRPGVLFHRMGIPVVYQLDPRVSVGLLDPESHTVVAGGAKRVGLGEPGDELSGPANGEIVRPDPRVISRNRSARGVALPVEINAHVTAGEGWVAGEVVVVEIVALNSTGQESAANGGYLAPFERFQRKSALAFRSPGE